MADQSVLERLQAAQAARTAQPAPDSGGGVLERLEAARAPSRGEKLRQAASSLASGGAEVAAGVFESLAFLAEEGRKFNAEIRQRSELGGLPPPDVDVPGGARRFAGEVRALAKHLLPPEPKAQGDFLADTVPQAVGSGLGFMAGGAAMGLARAPALLSTAGLGAMSNAAAEHTAAELGGASDEEAARAWLAGFGVGTTEAVPLAGMLNRVTMGTGRIPVARFLSTLAREGAEEGIQETAQLAASNAIAKHVARYDEDRELLEGIVLGEDAGEQPAAGFLSGILLSALTQGAGMARRAAASGDAAAFWEELDQAQQEAKEKPLAEGEEAPAPTEDELVDALVRGEEVDPEAVAPELARRATLGQIGVELSSYAETVGAPPDVLREALARIEAAEDPIAELQAVMDEWQAPPEAEVPAEGEVDVEPRAVTSEDVTKARKLEADVRTAVAKGDTEASAAAAEEAKALGAELGVEPGPVPKVTTRRLPKDPVKRAQRIEELTGQAIAAKDDEGLAWLNDEREKLAAGVQPEATGNPAADKLRGAAAKVRAKAEEEIGRERLENTPKRERQASAARKEARRQIELADAMDLVAGSDSPALAGLTTKPAVDAVLTRMRLSEDTDDRKGMPIRFGEYVHPSNVRGALEILKGTRGLPDLRDAVQSLTRGERSNSITTAEEADALSELAKMLRAKGKMYEARNLSEPATALRRLLKAGITSQEQLEGAVAELRKLMGGREGPSPEAQQAEAIAKAESAVRFRKIPGFFPTPKAAIERILEEAAIEPGQRVLEPSAGKGDLADAAREAGGEVTAHEIVPDLSEILRLKGYEPRGDFMESQPTGDFDRVVMNPPFERRQDAAHVQRAYDFLAPGGRLVAVMSPGPFTGSAKADKAFQEWVEGVGATVTELPSGTFKGADAFRQTGVETRLLVVDKPTRVYEEKAAPADRGAKAPTLREWARAQGGLAFVEDLERLTARELGDMRSVRRRKKGGGFVGYETPVGRPLVRKPGDGGLSLDEAGELATEAGYFAERPTPAEMLEALELDVPLVSERDAPASEGSAVGMNYMDARRFLQDPEADIDEGEAGSAAWADPEGANEHIERELASGLPVHAGGGPRPVGDLPAAMAPLEPPREDGTTNLGMPIGGRLLGRLATPEEPSKGKPVSRPQILHALSKVMGAAGGKTPIRVGRMGGAQARGFFKVGPEIIRIKSADNVATAAHEVGHALEKHVYGWVQGSPWKKGYGVTRKMQQELVELGKALYGSRKPAAGYKREGFAEFFRLYVSEPATSAQRAPTFHAWWEGHFLEQAPKVRAEVENVRELIGRWRSQGAQARAEASIIDPTSLGERVKAGVRSVRRFFSREALVDMAAPLDDLAREAEKRLGRRLNPSEDPYFTTTALRTTQSARTKEMVERGMIDLAGNRTGPALNDIAALVKGRQRDFTIYLWAKRAEALWTDPNRAARDPGLSLQDARTILEELGSARFELAASKLYDWNDGVLTYAAQASPTYRKVVERIREVDPGSYIPLQREFAELDSIWADTRQTGQPAGGLAKRLKGSGRRIKNPLPAMIAQAERTVLMAHRRLVLDQAIKLSQIEGMGHLVEKVPVDRVPVAERTIEELLKEINERAFNATGEVFALTGDDSVRGDFVAESIAFFAPSHQPKGKDPVLPVWNGESMEWYQIDDRLMRVLGSLDIYRLPKVAELLFGLPAEVFRLGTTGLRASFGLITNPLRDFQTFYLNTQSRDGMPQRLLGAWLSQFGASALRTVTGERVVTPYLDAFLRLGGEMAQPLGQDIPHTGRAARRLFQGRMARTLDPRNAFDFLRDIIQFPEAAGRVAELKGVAREVGWEPGQPMTLDQSFRMLAASKQVTTDFTAAGEFARMWNRVVPFFNANIQGPRASFRAAKRNPGLFLMRGLQLTASTLALWWSVKDEEWYQELDAEARAMFWYVPVTLGEREELVRIPRAFEVGMVFGAMAEAFANAWYEQDPEHATRWFQQFLEVTVGGLAGEPVLLGEAFDQFANRDRFWDSPIVPRGEEDRPLEEQASEYTSRVATFLGETFGGSPRRIDHAIRGLGGGALPDLIELVGLGGAGAAGREREAADATVIGKLFQRGGRLGVRPKSVERAYEALEEARRRQASVRHEETPEERQERLMLSDATQALSALSFVRSQTDGVEERRAIMREIVDIAQDVLEHVEAGTAPRERFKATRKRAEAREEALK